MDNFIFFLKQGLSHISDIVAYDHILFISALAAFYSIRQWKKLLFLVTAFTIGHSIALALATFEMVQVNSAAVEFLIPVTIIATCLYNLYQLWLMEAPEENDVPRGTSDDLDYVEMSKDQSTKMFHVEHSSKFSYGVITFFGLIHGLGFSNYLRFILASDEGIFMPLLAFNLGLELGQILILSLVLALNFVLLEVIKVEQKIWSGFLSLTIILISLPILLETGRALFFES